MEIGGGRQRRQARRAERAGKDILGTPARFMRPRIILLVAAGILVAYGILMVYSASSITAQSSASTNHNPFYFAIHQAEYAVAGIALAVVLARMDYHLLAERYLKPLWGLTVILLLFIFLPMAGTDAYGASRWLSIAGFTFQPSEFAKITLVLTGANLIAAYEEGRIDARGLLKLAAIGLALPLALIIAQPDKGTVMVIACTLVVMGLLGGIDWRLCLAILVIGIVGMIALSMRDAYSRARIMTMFDPWQDQYGSGYQLIQGFYAFGSGGLFGLGIGMSRQKYAYLPFAHNDFIFAVIGEECGLLGTLGVIFGFLVVFWAGMQIARYAPDLEGRLIAAGCVTMLLVQLFLNVAGVIGVFPLSGKPIPFISYGGSSIVSSLMTIGLCASVSVHSHLPETSYDRRRRDLSVTEAPRGGRSSAWRAMDDDGVGEPQPRSRRAYGAAAGTRAAADDAPRRPSARSTTLKVHEGGLGTPRAARPATGSAYGSGRDGRSRSADGREHPQGRLTVDASGHRRLDLGPTAAERLRKQDEGPTIRTRPQEGSRLTRGNGDRRGR